MGTIRDGHIGSETTPAFGARMVCSLALIFIACSPVEQSKIEEHVSQVSSPVITANTYDFPTVGYTTNQELSVAYVPGAGPSITSPAPGRWVVATINTLTYLTTGWSWMYSTDGNGNSWTFQNQQNWNDFGCPGDGTQGAACPSSQGNCAAATSNPGYSGSGNDCFTGWNNDPTIAAVTDSGWGTGAGGDWKKTVVGVADAQSQQYFKFGNIIAALSTDGGQTWGNGSQGGNVAGTIQWVGTNPTNGNGVDLPFVFSNPSSDYHDTYVSWRADQGYLRKIKYDLTQSPPKPLFGPVVQIPKEGASTFNTIGDTAPNRFNFGFATLPAGCTSGQEGIFVVYVANTPNLRCNNSNCCNGSCPSDTHQNAGAIFWNMAIYDTGAQAWLSDGSGHHTFTIDSSPVFDVCVGVNPSMPNLGCGVGQNQICAPGTACPWYSNSADPHIAVDPTNDWVWVSHTMQTTTSPVQAWVDVGQLQCNGGVPAWPPINWRTPWRSRLRTRTMTNGTQLLQCIAMGRISVSVCIGTARTTSAILQPVCFPRSSTTAWFLAQPRSQRIRPTRRGLTGPWA